jgi:hypothetical protein
LGVLTISPIAVGLLLAAEEEEEEGEDLWIIIARPVLTL